MDGIMLTDVKRWGEYGLSNVLIRQAERMPVDVMVKCGCMSSSLPYLLT